MLLRLGSYGLRLDAERLVQYLGSDQLWRRDFLETDIVIGIDNQLVLRVVVNIGLESLKEVVARTVLIALPRSVGKALVAAVGRRYCHVFVLFIHAAIERDEWLVLLGLLSVEPRQLLREVRLFAPQAVGAVGEVSLLKIIEKLTLTNISHNVRVSVLSSLAEIGTHFVERQLVFKERGSFAWRRPPFCSNPVRLAKP